MSRFDVLFNYIGTVNQWLELLINGLTIKEVYNNNWSALFYEVFSKFLNISENPNNFIPIELYITVTIHLHTWTNLHTLFHLITLTN